MKVSIIKYFKVDGDHITLGQFLKEESIISSGGQAKWYLKDNPVTLNGELEDRRGKKMHVGDHFYAGQNLKVIDCNVIKIGDYVQVGDNCGIYTSNHAFDPQKRADHWCSDHPITIGSHVSIGNDVTILPGITIGANTIVQSGSIVAHDLPANVVAAGAPCTVIENLSDKAE